MFKTNKTNNPKNKGDIMIQLTRSDLENILAEAYAVDLDDRLMLVGFDENGVCLEDLDGFNENSISLSDATDIVVGSFSIALHLEGKIYNMKILTLKDPTQAYFERIKA